MSRRKKPALSTVMAFMSDETQNSVQVDTDSQVSQTLPIATILPDPGQPRRLLPEDLIEAVTDGTMTTIEAVQHWIERGEADNAETGVRRNVHELKRLAQSIAQHGLINPISVREPRSDETLPPGIDYLIVTGERRFWAHVYLTSQEQLIQEGQTTASPDQIKATIAPPGVTIRAHQFIENLLREDINAVERARGMWSLRYELSGVNRGSPSTDSATEAEVNHGSPDTEINSKSLVPWARVEEILGISKRYRIFTTSVMNLSPEAQAIIENHSLAERTIRPIVQKLKGKPKLQVQALEQLVAWQAENEAEDGPARSLVASVKELVEKLLAAEARAKAAPESTTASMAAITRAVSSAPVIRFRNKVRQTLDFLNRLKAEDKTELTQALEREEFADIMVDLRNLRQQIDVLLGEEIASQETTNSEEGDE